MSQDYFSQPCRYPNCDCGIQGCGRPAPVKPKFRYYKGVRYVAAGNPAPATFARCGTCGRAWDDDKSTGLTPAPSGRCPFEYMHKAPHAFEVFKGDDANDAQTWCKHCNCTRAEGNHDLPYRGRK